MGRRPVPMLSADRCRTARSPQTRPLSGPPHPRILHQRRRSTCADAPKHVKRYKTVTVDRARLELVTPNWVPACRTLIEMTMQLGTVATVYQ